MIQPISLTVTELAARWQCTTRQVFERAKFMQLLLYFHFDGEAYDVLEERRRTSFDWENRQEAEHLQKTIGQIDAQLGRLARGEVSEWEQTLSHDEAAALGSDRKTSMARLEAIAEMFRFTAELRERSIFTGDLVAAPQTVTECEQKGSAPFPTFAYHPGHGVRTLPMKGADYGIVEGRMLRLGPRNDSRQTIGANDLRARTLDVEALESESNARGNSSSTARAPKPAEYKHEPESPHRPVAHSGLGTVHRTKYRVRLLDSEIAAACASTGTSDQHSVWTALIEMALAATVPFTGEVDASKGIAYNKDAAVAYLSKDALRQRLKKLVDNGR